MLQHCNTIMAFMEYRGENKIVLRIYGWRNPHQSGWRISKESLIEMDLRGEIIWRNWERPLCKTYFDYYQGTPFGNLWLDSNPAPSNKETTGYPALNPVALLERIVKAS